jgi:hypothetical protein
MAGGIPGMKIYLCQVCHEEDKGWPSSGKPEEWFDEETCSDRCQLIKVTKEVRNLEKVVSVLQDRYGVIG